MLSHLTCKTKERRKTYTPGRADRLWPTNAAAVVVPDLGHEPDLVAGAPEIIIVFGWSGLLKHP